jgi:hypothetical protein
MQTMSNDLSKLSYEELVERRLARQARMALWIAQHAAACPSCKTKDKIEISQQYDGSYSVVCDNCYDADWQGEETGYVSDSLVAQGGDQEEAIAAWNDLVAEWHEVA